MPNRAAIAPKPLVVEFTPAEAAALIKAADMGVIVYREAALVQTTATMEAAVRKIRAAQGAR